MKHASLSVKVRLNAIHLYIVPCPKIILAIVGSKTRFWMELSLQEMTRIGISVPVTIKHLAVKHLQMIFTILVVNCQRLDHTYCFNIFQIIISGSNKKIGGNSLCLYIMLIFTVINCFSWREIISLLEIYLILNLHMLGMYTNQ